MSAASQKSAYSVCSCAARSAGCTVGAASATGASAVGWQAACRLGVPALFAMAVVFSASLWLTVSHVAGWGERAWPFTGALAALCGGLVATLLLPLCDGPRWLLTGVGGLATLCVLPKDGHMVLLSRADLIDRVERVVARDGDDTPCG